jgi:hypothetical protein
MLNFCTLFDYNFLPYGLNLHYSLLKNCKNFHLYIFAFDDRCFKVLTKLKLSHTTIITLSEFEDNELLAVKPTRTNGEYCWTCTPSTILFCLNKFNLDSCTYVDSDVFFYDNPQHLINEMGNSEILLTLHRYSQEYDQTEKSGKFCVQFMTFLNKKDGRIALEWWRKACLNWCFNRVEDGKFGDQKYLDDWEIRFDKVHVLQNRSGGIAPWNIQQFEIKESNSLLYIKNLNFISRLNFYHFHGLRFTVNGNVNLSEYKLPDSALKYLYEPYIKLYKKHYLKSEKANNSLKWFYIWSKLRAVKVKISSYLK